MLPAFCSGFDYYEMRIDYNYFQILHEQNPINYTAIALILYEYFMTDMKTCLRFFIHYEEKKTKRRDMLLKYATRW